MGRVDFLFGQTIVIAKWVWDPSERREPEPEPRRERPGGFRRRPFGGPRF